VKDQFQFKQFTIRHDRCAMKVGTDGVLLGAWGAVAAPRILDIGTGTGLIALMAAQRQPDAQVLGIDIDGDAVEQARENVAASPFADRVTIRHQSLQELVADVGSFVPQTAADPSPADPSGRSTLGELSTINYRQRTTRKSSEIHGNISDSSVSFPLFPLFQPSARHPATLDPSRTLNSQLSTFNFQLSPFSAILCNPPFFEETLLPPDARRSQARHTPTLPFPFLIDAVPQLLMPGGTFSVILPTTAFDDFRLRCFASNLVCTRLCYVQTTPEKAPKRVLATFHLHPSGTSLATSGTSLPTSEQSLPTSEQSPLPSQCDGPTTLILNNGPARTPEYAALTRDFYLW